MPSRSSYPHPTVVCLSLLSACTNAPVASGVPTSDLAGTPVLAGVPDTAEFRELIAADWELEPGTERYICVRQTFAETTFVSAWRGDAPAGTHHVLVTTSVQPDGQPDGQFECDAGTLGTQNVFGAGVGTPDRRLPPGIAYELAQGTQAILNLHLFNPTDEPLRGRSGARIQTTNEQDVREIADTLTATAIKLDVPPGRSTSHARCTFDRDATIFGVGPHMHQMGVALRAVAHTAINGDVVLYDGPYSFEDQRGYPLDRLQFKAGDTVEVACTFENTTANTLHFGGSSNDEMCQVSLARIPAGGPSLCFK